MRAVLSFPLFLSRPLLQRKRGGVTLPLPEYRCFTSWDSNWSLNAVMLQRKGMLEVKYPPGRGINISGNAPRFSLASIGVHFGGIGSGWVPWPTDSTGRDGRCPFAYRTRGSFYTRRSRLAPERVFCTTLEASTCIFVEVNENIAFYYMYILIIVQISPERYYFDEIKWVRHFNHLVRNFVNQSDQLIPCILLPLILSTVSYCQASDPEQLHPMRVFCVNQILHSVHLWHVYLQLFSQELDQKQKLS
jgi:hypothetical protein